MADATPRLYADLAWLWPHLSPPHDYEAEANTLRRRLRKRLGPAGPGVRRTLVEFGAGGGHTLYHLREDYECVAVDLSAPMLTNCGMLNPDVRCEQGDMRTVRLGERFDAVLLHDAVDYMLSEDDLRRTLNTVKVHLKPGGIAFIAPTYTAETFTDRHCETDQHEHGPLTVSFLSYIHDPEPADTTFEMVLVYVIDEAGDVQVVEDRHNCGLFSEATWTRLIDEAGLNVETVTDDTGGNDVPYRLFIATAQ